MGAPKKEDGFLGEMRAYAMKLHTKEQAPKEGQAEEPSKPMSKWEPTRELYAQVRAPPPARAAREGFRRRAALTRAPRGRWTPAIAIRAPQYLVDSKVVYDALEEVVASAPADSPLAVFQSTGLERGPALAKDLEFFESEYGIKAPEPTEAGSGYAAFLREKAASDVPGFMCHYYNVYFAHTAGGRQIGKMLSDMVLDGKKLEFYSWEGVLKDHMDGVRGSINSMAEGWSEEEKTACLEETAPSFKYAGTLLRILA
eukprot:PRCOL_00003428-RA